MTILVLVRNVSVELFAAANRSDRCELKGVGVEKLDLKISGNALQRISNNTIRSGRSPAAHPDIQHSENQPLEMNLVLGATGWFRLSQPRAHRSAFE